MVGGRKKGTPAETALANYLRENGFPYAERRALAGINDKGDITGTPGLVWEVKNQRSYVIPAWMKETEQERVNASAEYGFLIVKPNGVGLTSVKDWWAVLTVSDLVELVNFAGFGDKR